MKGWGFVLFKILINWLGAHPVPPSAAEVKCLAMGVGVALALSCDQTVTTAEGAEEKTQAAPVDFDAACNT